MTNEELEQKEWEILQEFLETATPEEWHIYAAASNYDGNSQGIEWLINNPKIDKATALSIYWYMGAAWYVQFASEAEAIVSYDKETYKMLRLLEQRYTDGFYADYDIWYDPMHPEVGRANDYPKIPVKSPIPELMLKSVGTKVIDLYPEDYDEGIPFEVIVKIDALYDEFIRLNGPLR